MSFTNIPVSTNEPTTEEPISNVENVQNKTSYFGFKVNNNDTNYSSTHKVSNRGSFFKTREQDELNSKTLSQEKEYEEIKKR